MTIIETMARAHWEREREDSDNMQQASQQGRLGGFARKAQLNSGPRARCSP